MESKDLYQLITTSLAFSPTVLLLQKVMGQSLIVSNVSPLLPEIWGFVNQMIWFHAFLVVFGVGLLIGVRSLTVNALIAAGLGGVITLTGGVSNMLGLDGSVVPSLIVDSLSPYLAKPVASDIFLMLPFILIPLGLMRWSRLKRSEREKFRNEALEAVRSYCPQCGVYVDPNVKRCRSCRAEVHQPLGGYCGSCGRPIGKTAKFCSWCGEEVRIGQDAECAQCKSPVPLEARFCGKCGARLPQAAEQPEAAV